MWKGADVDVLWTAVHCRCKHILLMLIFQRALSKMGLTMDKEGLPQSCVKAQVCGSQTHHSQRASSPLAAYELEMSATFFSPNAYVQPLNDTSDAVTE